MKKKLSKSSTVETLNYWLYELTAYQITSKGFSLLESRFIKSAKALKTKKKIIKINQGVIEISCDLLGAPKTI